MGGGKAPAGHIDRRESMNASKPWTAVCLTAVGLVVSSARAGSIATVPVANCGNIGDSEVMSLDGTSGYGSVGHAYMIGKYEVTAGQYCEFLNAVAQTDIYGLYSTSMWPNTLGCKIQRSGPSGSFTYNVAADWANRPVNFVSYGDALRFSNWLSNGQPVGAQNALTTEDGSYTLNGATSTDALMVVPRNGRATWVVPSEDEWYKAAFYDPDRAGGGGYWDYPTRSDTAPSNAFSATGTNNANFYKGSYTIGAPYYRTEVGAFAGSPSAYGTFDQGGNVWEWNEATIYINGGSFRGVRGAAFYYSDSGYMRASYRNGDHPEYETWLLGFRVAAVPDPATLSLLVLVGAGLVARRRYPRV
jgi:formylglycine-generating enzyme